MQNSAVQSTTNPAWYAALLNNAAMGGLPPDMVAGLLKKSLELAPGYEVPLAGVVTYSMPKWGGSAQMLEAFAQVALSTAGPEAYALLYTNALRTTPCNCEIAPGQLKLNWTTYVQGMTTRIQKYPGLRSVNQLAAASCNTRHRETSSALMGQLLNVGVHLDTWKEFDRDPECLRWATTTYEALNAGKPQPAVTSLSR